MTQTVECFSGWKYAERPIALHWEGQRLEIAAVEAQWLTPEGRHFQVCTRDNRFFELIYDEYADVWIIKPI